MACMKKRAVPLDRTKKKKGIGGDRLGVWGREEKRMQNGNEFPFRTLGRE